MNIALTKALSTPRPGRMPAFQNVSMNLSNMSLKELRELEMQVRTAIINRGKADKADAISQIEEIAKSVGISLQELVGVPRAKGAKADKRTGSVAVRYQHPENPEQKWTGRGRSPSWIKAWLESGQSMDALRITPEPTAK